MGACGDTRFQANKVSHSNGIFWDRFLKTALSVFERTPLEARNRIGHGTPPPRLKNLVVIYIDESKDVYFPSGDVQFDLDLQAFISWKNSLSEIDREGVFPPMVNKVEQTSSPIGDLSIGDISPTATPFPTAHFQRFGEIGRSEGIGNYTLVPQFRTRFIQYLNRSVPGLDLINVVHFLVDSSGSMSVGSIEPGFMIPDHNGESVKLIIEEVYNKRFEFRTFNTERWIQETLTYLQGL